MSEIWETIHSSNDRGSAEALAGWLRSEDIDVKIEETAPALPGLDGNFSVRVPAALVDRANKIAEKGVVSDEELEALAAGSADLHLQEDDDSAL